jgi:integrase
MAARNLTTAALRWNGADRWLTDGGSRGEGRLAARVKRDNVLLYFRYRADGQNRALPLGTFSATGESGMTLRQARDKVAELTALLRDGVTDLHAHLRREQAAREAAAREAEEAVRRAAEDAKRGTLEQLCHAYVDHLERGGKQSARDVRNLFGHHVLEADLVLAARRAADLDAEALAGLIGRVVQDGKGRTAGKLRSYLRAAYTLAATSHTDPSVPLIFRSFGVRANPLASVPALARFNKARDRVLTATELGALLRRIDALEGGQIRDALLLTLYLGGQRPAQLVRVTAGDVDLDGATVTLRDPKGRRSQPRQHVLPLVAEALEICRRRSVTRDGDARLFTCGPETLSATVAALSRDMVVAGEIRDGFQLRDLRRTCETQMAALGVSSDVRAQLQSHGLGGIQQRHYDKHSYMPEKKRTLERWRGHLQALKAGKHGANVVRLVGEVGDSRTA